MNLNEMLDLAFEQFLSHTVTDELLKSIKSSVTSADVDTLITKVESLDDPSAYCKNDFSVFENHPYMNKKNEKQVIDFMS